MFLSDLRISGATPSAGGALAAAPTPLTAGDVVAGVYEITGLLARGDSSVVYEARHVTVRSAAVVKVIVDPHRRGSSALEATIAATRALGAAHSPHIVRTLDVGLLPSGYPFLVMERLEGVDLAQFLATEGPLSVDAAAALGLQACDALHAVHGVGVLHGDLKPANLIVRRLQDGRLHLSIIDFSAAASTGCVSGSPGYASPEQLGTRSDIDVRTDVWALGAVLYEMVTGHRAFKARSLEAHLMAAVSESPPRMTSPRGPVPSAFDWLVTRGCLGVNREVRFAGIDELSRALKPFASAPSRRAPPPLPMRASRTSVPAPASGTALEVGRGPALTSAPTQAATASSTSPASRLTHVSALAVAPRRVAVASVGLPSVLETGHIGKCAPAATDLTSIDLTSIDLTRTDFTSTDIAPNDLTSIDLTRTDFTSTDIAPNDLAAIRVTTNDLATPAPTSDGPSTRSTPAPRLDPSVESAVRPDPPCGALTSRLLRLPIAETSHPEIHRDTPTNLTAMIDHHPLIVAHVLPKRRYALAATLPILAAGVMIILAKLAAGAHVATASAPPGIESAIPLAAAARLAPLPTITEPGLLPLSATVEPRPQVRLTTPPPTTKVRARAVPAVRPAVVVR